MDSFFLSETIKYLFLMFDSENWLVRHGGWVLTTEAHFVPVFPRLSAGVSSCPAHRKAHPSFPMVSPLASSPKCDSAQHLQAHQQHLVLTGGITLKSPDFSRVPQILGLLGALGDLTIEAVHRAAVEHSVYWADPGHGCMTIPGDAAQGKLVVAVRGECTFMEKAFAAQKAGAVALIVVNHPVGDLFTMSIDPQVAEQRQIKVSIPSVLISHGDGEFIRRVQRSLAKAARLQLEFHTA
jgi:hypothetical protein